MKKFVFLLSGAVALTACSDNTFEEIDAQNYHAQTTTPTNESSGGMTTSSYTGANGYQSLWDIHYRNREMFYHYVNDTGSTGTPAARLEFVVTPYIGLAYCDDYVLDNIFYDESVSPAIPKGFFISSPSNYPNIFMPTFTEI